MPSISFSVPKLNLLSTQKGINITIVGSRYYQHNYFFYPPASQEFCDANSSPAAGKANAFGSGVCGVNGGFKSFDAFGTSSHEKDGTMHSLPGAGSYTNFVNIAYPIDDETLLYTSTDNSTQFHSQVSFEQSFCYRKNMNFVRFEALTTTFSMYCI